MDTGSRGAILGLTTATTAADIYRACMEGVVYEMRLNYEAFRAIPVYTLKLHATGGGARSKVWMQMKGRRLRPTHHGTQNRGCRYGRFPAMLTGVAVGMFSDLHDAAAHMVQERETYYPRRNMHQSYMTIYERYKRVYDAVRPLL